MQTELLRSDGLGIAGTYRNAECHANACKPLIVALEALSPALGFKTWKQGHNVHVFETADGRRFDIIPYAKDVIPGTTNSEYIGLQFRIRESRSKATPIMAITEIGEVPLLYNVMQCVAKPMPKNLANNLKDNP